MIPATLLRLLIVIPLASGSETLPKERGRSNPKESVQGRIVMHGEYPHFIRRVRGKDIAYDIRINDAEWRENYGPVLKSDMTFSEPTYCVIAIGYEDENKLGQTGRSTFVFNRIKSTKEVNDERECFP